MKRFREDIHRCRFLLPCALAAVLLLRWAVMRGRPERVIEIPLGPMAQWIGIAGGKAVTFGVGSSSSDLVVRSKALDGGAANLIVRHPSEQSDVGAFLAGNYVYYINVWYRPGAEGAAKARGLWTGFRLEPNPGLPPAQPARPGEPVRPPVLGLLSFGARGRFADRIRTTLHRAPLQGGAPEEVNLLPGGTPPVFSSLGVIGNRIFWTRRRNLSPAEAAAFRRNGKPPLFMPAHHELWVTRVGGPAVLLYAGVFQYARLTPSGHGVYWRLVRPASPHGSESRDLLYVAADSLKVTLRRAVSFEPATAPVFYRGRVYWINDPAGLGVEPGESDFGGRRDLVSAKPDGSDMRVVLNLATASQVNYRLGRLYAYGGRLYATLLEQRAGGPNPIYFHYLCFVDPDRDPAITRLTRLPRRLAERGVFDSGYYYFLVNEPRDSLFDWSTEDKPLPDRYILYRWKLPEGSISERGGA